MPVEVSHCQCHWHCSGHDLIKSDSHTTHESPLISATPLKATTAMRCVQLLSLLAALAQVARGVQIKFYTDSACTNEATYSGWSSGEKINITAYSDQDTTFPVESVPDYGDHRDFGLKGDLLKITTCTSSSIVFTPYMGTCSSSAGIPVEPR